MFISRAQLARSLRALDTVHPFFGIVFLALKEVGLSVGDRVMEINFTNTVEAILKRYYYPLPGHSGFYSPFKTSNKANRWQGERYASTTLQRITVDTFGEAFIHPKGSQQWSWQSDYVHALAAHLPKGQVPVFDLAVWLYRQEELPSNDAGMLIEKFLGRFDITPQESINLFDTEVPRLAKDWYQPKPLVNADILAIIGYPSGADAAPNGVIQSIELSGVGPSQYMRYEPAERLNLITGDNSLGKTFLFDCMWWAITRQWPKPKRPAIPDPDALLQVQTPSISYTLQAVNGEDRRSQKVVSPYDWSRQRWNGPTKPGNVEAGLAIYARFDGSFVVWDATMQDLGEAFISTQHRGASLLLSSEEVWEGLQTPNNGWACRGLLNDWTTWQRSGNDYAQEWASLELCLAELTKGSDQPFKAGKPRQVNVGDTTDIPVLVMSYGNVPVIHASAGIRRILALAYMLVWAWFRHRRNSKIIGQDPQHRLVLFIDEAEAHLHPRWQRAIVPAIMAAVDSLAQGMAPQIHLATHSPLVMASAEVVFDEELDDSHHLHLTADGKVELRELGFFKRGTADRWLVDEFELKEPRSKPAEDAIQRALAIQRRQPGEISKGEIASINQQLLATIADLDEFWPRWRYFAHKNGVETVDYNDSGNRKGRA